MAAHVRRLPRFAAELVTLLVLLAGCSPKITAPPEPPYSVRRGDEAFRYQDYKGAISSYRYYLDETPKDAYTARVLYKMALAEYRQGHYDDTLVTLGELGDRYPKGHWVQVDALRGDAYRELHRPITALESWGKGWDIADENDQRKLRQRIVSLARGLDDAELAQAQRTVSNDEVRLLLEQQIASRQPPGLDEPFPEDEDLGRESSAGAGSAKAGAKASGAPPVAAAAVKEPAPPPAAAPQAVSAPAAEVKPGRGKVACLLPLSGPSQELGARALRGLRLLFGEASDRLVVVDTGKDGAGTPQLFNEVSRDPDVLAVIGPLRAEEAATIAPLARQGQMPLFLLSPRDGLAGGSVLQIGVTQTRLVETLLQYSMDKVRMRRFGILHPEGDAAKQFVASFRSNVERRGGTIVGVEGYLSREPVLPAVTLKRWHDSQHVQALFLPDDEQVAQAVARFLQRDMPDVMLLGVSGWEALAGNAGVNGILFADGFYSGSTRPGTRQFVERFQQAYGAMPGTVEAQAYDAGLLAFDALDASVRSRAELLQTLQIYGPVEGATGRLNVTPAGVERQLYLLQVYDGTVQEVGDGSN
jgi:branched-chain amino acid transport system substrate-binding protein